MSAKRVTPISTTPFPNVLLDQIMPTLKDTEWRLLCVVVRQTLGWQDRKTGARKTSDWLTQRQLVSRTGRSSEALSRALDSLVRQSLIQVHGRTGRLLDSPSKRRQARGHIRYALHLRFLKTNVPPEVRKNEFWAPKSDPRSSLLRSPSCKSEYGETAKANGTKETTKQNVTKPSEEHHEFVRQYREIYRIAGYGIHPEPNEDTHEALAKLFRQHSGKELSALRTAFFACEAKTIIRAGHTLECFVRNANLLAFGHRAAKASRSLSASANGGAATQKSWI